MPAICLNTEADSIRTTFISISQYCRLSHNLVSIFSNTQQRTVVTHVNNPTCQSLHYVACIDSVTHTASLANFCLRKQIYNLSIHYSSLPLEHAILPMLCVQKKNTNYIRFNHLFHFHQRTILHDATYKFMHTTLVKSRVIVAGMSNG